MENSRRRQLSASLDTPQDPFADPFGDPTPSGSSGNSVHDSFSDHSVEIETRPSASQFRPALVRKPVASNLRRQSLEQHQPRYAPVPTHSRRGSDEILPIAPIGQDPFQDFPEPKRPWELPYDGDSSPTWSELSTRRAIPEPLDRSPKKIKTGKTLITITKWIFVFVLLCSKYVGSNFKAEISILTFNLQYVLHLFNMVVAKILLCLSAVHYYYCRTKLHHGPLDHGQLCSPQVFRPEGYPTRKP